MSTKKNKSNHSSFGADYGKADYWDERYSVNSDGDTFDWYQRWSGLKSFLEPKLKLDSSILMVGCGNSTLSIDMYNNNYKNITNIDISGVVINQMLTRYPMMTWLQMDVMKMTTFSDNSFNVIIDKGTLDAILCGDNSTVNAEAMLREISRLLTPNGVFFEITYGLPENRLNHISKSLLNWTIVTDKIGKSNDTKEPDCHYIYICTKTKN